MIVNQEHQTRGAELMDLQYDAHNAGWNLHGSPAAKTLKDGLSAGVAVAVRKSVGCGLVHGKSDHSPRSSPGRLSAVWVQAGPDTGFLVASLYMYHSEGMSIRNRKLLEHALAVVKSYGPPWLICGDFNMTPEELTTLFGYALNLANAYVFAPRAPTHFSDGGANRTLDYLICSDTAHQWVDSIYVDQGLKVSPHRAVRVRIRAERHNFKVAKLNAPKQFPVRKPIGCARLPVLPVWDRGVSVTPTVPDSDGHIEPSVGSASILWPALIHAMESELCGITDQVHHSGAAKRSFTGRARGVSTALRMVLPKRTSASLGKVDARSHALRWFAIRVKELAHVSKKVRDGELVSQGAAAQCDDIMAKITINSGLVQIVRLISKEWDTMVQSVRKHVPGMDTALLFGISQCADDDAVEHKRKHAEERADYWRLHVARQLKNGAAATHRWVKRDSAPPAPSDTVGSGAARTASPQAIVDHDLLAWKAIWTRPVDAGAPWREARIECRQPPITAQQVRKAAATFRSGTSIGCDSLPPVAVSWLSDQLCGSIAAFLNAVEGGGRWPDEVATSLIHLIPKPGGGRRPIGVLPTIVRIWERTRKGIAQRWSREHQRAFDWATQGRSSESAAWHQSLLDEAAKGRHQQSAAVFLDLAKAFEMVRLEDIWRAGVHFGFPLDILRLALEAFSFARRLSFQGAVSEAVYSLSAILAGGGFAQLALLLVLLRPLDRMVFQYTGCPISFCLYVDDIALHATGASQQVLDLLSAATSEIVQILEDDLAMKVSRRSTWATHGDGKTIAAASSQALTRRLSTPMRRLGIQMKNKAKHLGVLFGPGARTREPPRRASRWTANSARRARVMRLGRRLGTHIFRTAVTPATLYGSSVAMPRLGTERSMRRDAARAFGPLRGRSTTARLAVNRCDPALQIVGKPIASWCQAVWDARIPSDTLQSAWKFASCRMIQSGKPSVSAGGAAGAFISAIRRIHWTAPSFDHVRTRDGTVIDLAATAPYTVMQVVEDDFAIVAAAATSIASRLTLQCAHNDISKEDGTARGAASCGARASPESQGSGHTPCSRTIESCRQPMVYREKLVPWFAPIASVVGSKWSRSQSPAAVASASALAEGGWWPQERLAAEGLAADPFCRACLSDTSSTVGSLWHR